MGGSPWVGVLTLLGGGVDPRLVYHIDIPLEDGDTPTMVADFYAGMMSTDTTVYFPLAEAEHGAGAFLVVRTERIESFVINPAETTDP